MNALEIADLAKTLQTFIVEHVDPADPKFAAYEEIRTDIVNEMQRVIAAT
jgi:hypothetical protein